MPEILNRKDAVTNSQLRYFTGEPCKRGHVSERYTKNGACLTCLDVAKRMTAETVLATPNARRDALQSLVEVGVRIFHADLTVFGDVAAAMVLARYPVLSRADVVLNRFTHEASGTGFYKFRLVPEEVTLLREVAQAYCSKRAADGAAARQKALGLTLQMVESEAKNNGVGEWKFT